MCAAQKLRQSNALYQFRVFCDFYIVIPYSLFVQVRNEFQVTKKMSTYLVAFVICDFGKLTEKTVTNKINVSVAASADKLDQAQFALHTAANITDFYEKYFGIRYPLPKQGKFSKHHPLPNLSRSYRHP